MADTATALRRGPARWMWFAVGLVAVGLGGLGVVVPGLPTTGFFVLAAACFSKSSPRFEAWVLNLPGVGQMVRDYRGGLGMPRRAKVIAIGCMLAVGGPSTGALAGDQPVIAGFVAALLAVGVWYVGWRVPTRERVVDALAPGPTSLSP